MNNLMITGGRVIDPRNQIDTRANVYLCDGKIVSIAVTPPPGYTPNTTIDATGYFVCPGLVDINATIFSHSLSLCNFPVQLECAVKAGITHLATHAFTPQYGFNATEIQQLRHQSASFGMAKAYFIGALTKDLAGNQLNELALLREAGCIGVSNGYQSIANTLVKRRCYEYAAMVGLKIYTLLHDPYLGAAGCMHEGTVSVRLGLPGIPVMAESIALAQELILVEEAGIQAHFYHLSAANTIALLTAAAKKNLAITSDATIPHLFITEEDVRLENGLCHVKPPFRSQADRIALRQAVKTGNITAVSSGHIMLPKEAKAVPFQDSTPGLASWPLLLPLTLQMAREDNLPLLTAIGRITSDPAAILGIDAGHLNLNVSANLIVVDPQAEWTLSAAMLAHFGANNPCADWLLQGKLKATIVDGRLVYQD